MNWVMKEFDSMTVEELENTKRILERQLCHEHEIAENIVDYMKYLDKLDEINDLEIQYETICQILGIL